MNLASTHYEPKALVAANCRYQSVLAVCELMSASIPMSRATATTSALHLPQEQWQRADLHHIHMVSRMQSLRKTENRHRAFNIMPHHSCFERGEILALICIWIHEIHTIV